MERSNSVKPLKKAKIGIGVDFMAKSIPMEKIIFAMLTIFNILAIITMFEFDSYIVPMVWADVWILGILKGEKVLKTYVGLKAARPLKKKKPE